MSSRAESHDDLDLTTHAEVAAGLTHGSFTVVGILAKPVFDRGHIPGSEHLDLSAVDETVKARFRDSGAPIVVYCSGFT